MSDARLWLAGLVALPAARDRRVVSSSLTSNASGGWRSPRRSAMLLAALVIAVSPRLRALLDPHVRAQLGSRRRGRSFASTRSRPSSCRSRRVCGCSPSRSRRAPRSIAADCAGRPSPRSSRSRPFSRRARSCSCSCRWPPSGRSCPRWRTRRIGISAASWRRIWASRRCSLASASRCSSVLACGTRRSKRRACG